MTNNPDPFEIRHAVEAATATGRAHAFTFREDEPVRCLCGWVGGIFRLLPPKVGSYDRRMRWDVDYETGATTEAHVTDIRAWGEHYGVLIPERNN